MDRHHHILNAASNLLGISLVIVTGLRVSGHGKETFSDEIACVSALCFGASCLLSYAAIRRDGAAHGLERWADRVFLAGLVSSLAAVALIVFETA
ncbi:hypothetical protein [Chenggangzhangella methanolivorans]|uniref:Uncharacterized protein n=1 Tax=Chenggangzhangella methanolivorans TaxID=1437009 RepID=A0A9E6RDU1_9HYPH|nr:hypothetical protein [Chenggangzhangella methanolivorans]QZO01528.1 hypothetical protein K6K41_08925 [Chenggangzhangella methanolivorans]